MTADRMLIEPAIAVLASTPSVMRAMLAPLSADLIAAPGKDAWSARDVVAQHQRPHAAGVLVVVPREALGELRHDVVRGREREGRG